LFKKIWQTFLISQTQEILAHTRFSFKFVLLDLVK
jgi:hypothetical protein